jgi:ribosomal protein S5
MASLLRGILPNEGNMQCGDVKVRLSSGMTGVGLIAVAIYQICKVEKKCI